MFTRTRSSITCFASKYKLSNFNHMKGSSYKVNCLNPTFRRELVHWMIELCAYFSLKQDTLYLSINILDRYSTLSPFNPNIYQLVGLISLWIASKYEENYGNVPLCVDLEAACLNLFTKKAITQMELKILFSLNFNLGVPSCESFSGLITQSNTSKRVRCVARYLMELTICDIFYSKYSNFNIANAALNLSVWINSGYFEHPVDDCLNEIMNSCRFPPLVVFNKYSGLKYEHASLFVNLSMNNV